jgi:polar amino acid transport system substrate-binding protein
MESLKNVIAAVVACLAITGCATLPDTPRVSVGDAIAPTGKLRVALFDGNPVHAMKDPASGETKGIGHDMGKALAARLAVPYEPVMYSVLGAMLDAGKAGAWDVAFMGYSAERAGFLEFTPNHIEVQFGYVVPEGSSIASMERVDQPGVRVAVVTRGSPDTFLSGALKHATLVRAPAMPAAVELLRSGKADVLAGTKPAMVRVAASIPGARMLEGSPGSESVAMVMPKGRSADAIAYARQFVETAKAGGMVKDAIDRAGLQGVVVAQRAE